MSFFGFFKKEPADTASGTPEKSIDELLKPLSAQIHAMTVAEIARAIGRPERGVLVNLTRRKIKVKDFDGTQSFEERSAERRSSTQYGEINKQLMCPHCQTKGKVRSKSAEEVTSTKVVPIVGNSIKSKKKVTQMHCDNCGTTWNV